jgi:hypothetical protein
VAGKKVAAEQVDVELVQRDAQGVQFADEPIDFVVGCECMENPANPSEMAYHTRAEAGRLPSGDDWEQFDSPMVRQLFKPFGAI